MPIDFGRNRRAWYTYWAVTRRGHTLRVYHLTNASRRRFTRLLGL